jgi:hypothetical protein
MRSSVPSVGTANAPWLHPLAFHPMPGWQTGMSGNRHSVYVGPPAKRVAAPLESSAWVARNVGYRLTLSPLQPRRGTFWTLAQAMTTTLLQQQR